MKSKEVIEQVLLFGVLYDVHDLESLEEVRESPRYAVASFKNFVYAHDRQNLTFKACFLLPEWIPNSEPVTQSVLIELLDDVLLWDQCLSLNPETFQQYFRRSRGLRLYSGINKLHLLCR